MGCSGSKAVPATAPVSKAAQLPSVTPSTMASAAAMATKFALENQPASAACFSYSGGPKPPPCLQGRKGGQAKVRQLDLHPSEWALTVRQLRDLYEWCRALPEWRSDMDMTSFVEVFIKPWTAATGVSYAVLINEARPLRTKVMISHMWMESVEEFFNSLFKFVALRKMPDDTPIWICSFGLYQCADSAGPTISEQLALKPEPFMQVIQDSSIQEHGMVTVHTSQGDLYSRLWCVREMDEAMRVGIPISGAMPIKDVSDYNDVLSAIVTPYLEGPCLKVSTKYAKCHPDDERRIRQVIEGLEEPVHDGPAYKALDKRITDMRLKLYVDAYLDYANQSMGKDYSINDTQTRALRNAAALLIVNAPTNEQDARLLFTKLEEMVRSKRVSDVAGAAQSAGRSSVAVVAGAAANIQERTSR